MPIVADGLYSYNEVEFDKYGKSRVESKPIFDSANRMVKYVEITFSYSGTVSLASSTNPLNDTDSYINTIRRRLTQPGKPLLYQTKGGGTFSINVPGGIFDVGYGPKPDLFSFMPIGSKRACRVDWKATVRIPQCPNGDPVFALGIVEYTYSADWTMDLNGIHVYTVTGRIEIAKNFGINAPNNLRSADSFWETVYFPLEPGWQRDQRRRHLSEDRRVLTFTIQDRELPYPLPNGQTRAKITHTFRNTNRGFAMIQHRIHGVFSTDRSLRRFTSFQNFMICVNNIIANIRSQSAVGKNIIPLELECREEILDLEDSYSFSFLVAGVQRDSLIKSSGFWQEIPNTGFIEWLASVTNSAMAPRGGPNLSVGDRPYFDISKDVLVDLCDEPRPPLSQSNNVRPLNAAASNNSSDEQNENLQDFYEKENYETQESYSWLVWEMELIEVENNNVVSHKPLYGSTTQVDSIIDPEKPKSVRQFSGQIDPYSEVNTEKDAEDLIQQINTPTATVILRGRAVRYGFRVPCPKLFRYGDATIKQMSRVTKERNLGPTMGIPIYERTWEITYAINKPIKDSPNLVSPYPGLETENEVK